MKNIKKVKIPVVMPPVSILKLLTQIKEENPKFLRHSITNPKNNAILKGNYPLEMLFGEDHARRLLNGERLELADRWYAVRYENSKYIVISKTERLGLFFKIDPERGTAVEITTRNPAGDRSALVSSLSELESVGILQNGSCEALGFTLDELNSAKDRQLRLDRRLTEVDISDLSELKSSRSYSGIKTHPVYQGGGIIITPNSKVDGLYTHGASTCTILIAIARHSPSSDASRIGMAHIDENVPIEAIRNFLYSVETGGTLEVYVIGGLERLVFNILSVIEEVNADIKFFKSNTHVNRFDAAIVDSTGTVYYGMRADLNAMFDREELGLLQLQRLSGKTFNVQEI
ncbi:MAG: hypothetical protein Q7T16_00185 [Candidatus Burarchaeum sp.]|nr:hypothetical protein [Candidatus Burarchaeum sp.]MDO8339057.1 hypothetical protein [Candidatus Burarchaeum sp.]